MKNSDLFFSPRVDIVCKVKTNLLKAGLAHFLFGLLFNLLFVSQISVTRFFEFDTRWNQSFESHRLINLQSIKLSRLNSHHPHGTFLLSGSSQMTAIRTPPEFRKKSSSSKESSIERIKIASIFNLHLLDNEFLTTIFIVRKSLSHFLTITIDRFFVLFDRNRFLFHSNDHEQHRAFSLASFRQAPD